MDIYSDVVRDRNGAIIPHATVTVHVGSPSGALATIYNSAGTLISNPITADDNGRYAFRAVDGTYDLLIEALGYIPWNQPVALFSTPPIGVLTSGVWQTVSGLPRLLLTGTGTVTIDARNSLGTVTTSILTYTVSAATNQIEFPFFGSDTVAIKPTMTGTAAAEII